MSSLYQIPKIEPCSDVRSSDYDAVVVVAPSAALVKDPSLRSSLEAVAKVDAAAEGGVFVASCQELPSKRLVFSGTGKLDQDVDDVRRFGEAADKGIARAIKAGAKAPLLVVEGSEEFEKTDLVSVLGAFKALYVPLEAREAAKGKAAKAEKLGVFGEAAKAAKLAAAIEEGKVVCRDIGGSDPERMAPPNVAEYVKRVFDGTCVKLEVVEGEERLEREYPCFAAVNRAASVIPRHRGCVIWLTYEPPEGVDETLFLVGKGVTYDTGGADIKAGGIMAGMSRDKCGSAVVAGFFRALATLKPKGIKVVGAMAMVRNSVGANCYVADEIVTARSGVRLRVGNTDAEGRMAMVDVLCHAKEKALKETNPHLMTFATLTGHAVMAMGPYTAVLDNGPARKTKFAQSMFDTGERCGDNFEVSTLRREDYDLVVDKSGEFVDVLQCNNAASTRTPRGHQLPFAFMCKVSGIDDHQAKSKNPIKYTHFDVGGSSGELPHPTTAAGVTAMVVHFVEPRL